MSPTSVLRFVSPVAAPGESVVDRRERVWIAFTLAAAALSLGLRYAPLSDAAEASICLVRRLGGSCPGCGMTRAVALLLKGRLHEAFLMHPLAPPLALEAFLIWLTSGVLIFSKRWRTPGWPAINAWLVLHGAAAAVTWIVRVTRA